MTKVVRTACLSAFALLAGCGYFDSPEEIPSGCYYDVHRNHPVLKIDGKRARILLQTDVRDVDLIRTHRHVVVARPAFYLIEGPEEDRIVRNDAIPEIELPIASSKPMTIGIPDAPDGYINVRLGKPCRG